MTRAVLVPGTLALLPEYASIEDPVAELRAACLRAVGWLGADVTVLADQQGARVAEHLLASSTRTSDEPSYLVVGNGSARRTEKAPGHLDARASGFDSDLGRWLRDGRFDEVAALDRRLAQELWAGVDPIIELAGVPGLSVGQVDYEDDPFGVQYWVIRWASG